MLMGHPPPISPCGRAHAPPGCVEGLTPVPVSLVGQALVASDAERKEALAATCAAVPAIAPAGPSACQRVTGPTRAGRGTTGLLAGPMGARPMVLVGRGPVVAVVRSGAARRPTWHLGGEAGGERRGASLRQPCPRAWGGWRVRGGRVAALPQAAQGGTARRGGGATAPRQPALAGGTVAAGACPGPPLTVSGVSSGCSKGI